MTMGGLIAIEVFGFCMLFGVIKEVRRALAYRKIVRNFASRKEVCEQVPLDFTSPRRI